MILNEIIQKTKDDLEIVKSNFSFKWLESNFKGKTRKKLDVKKALTDKSSFNIIAEVKKASPSKGVIRDDFDPINIADEYTKSGAAAISVLTEQHYFKGSLEYLLDIRKTSTLPLLRKDFIVDKYQILQADIFGADFILLIAKALSADELKELFLYAKSLGLEVLVETHDKDDIQKALYTNADIIGINHRNLMTFEMDMSLSKNLMQLLPKDKIVVAESGIYSHSQLCELKKIGVSAFLIGEHFMRQNDITQALKDIKGEI